MSNFFKSILGNAWNHVENVGKGYKEDPERAFLGINTPMESKLWGGITGKEYDPLMNDLIIDGSAYTDKDRETAQAKGIDQGPQEETDSIARVIASMFAAKGIGGALGAGSAGGAEAVGTTPIDIPVAAEGGAAAGGAGWQQYAKLGMNAAQNASKPGQQPQSQSATPNLEGSMPNPQQPQFFDPNAAGGGQRAQYDLMLKLADMGVREKNLKQQMSLAEELRKTPAPDIRSNGRVMRAAHPLEHLNTGVRQGIGYYQRNQGMQAQTQMADEIRRRIQEERDRQMGGGIVGATPTEPGMAMPMYEET